MVDWVITWAMFHGFLVGKIWESELSLPLQLLLQLVFLVVSTVFYISLKG